MMSVSNRNVRSELVELAHSEKWIVQQDDGTYCFWPSEPVCLLDNHMLWITEELARLNEPVYASWAAYIDRKSSEKSTLTLDPTLG
jgi:hypothetical protein